MQCLNIYIDIWTLLCVFLFTNNLNIRFSFLENSQNIIFIKDDFYILLNQLYFKKIFFTNFHKNSSTNLKY